MYSRKKALVEVPEELTDIWACTTEGCKGWMRRNFTFEVEPTCHICMAEMVPSTKMLPSLINFNNYKK